MAYVATGYVATGYVEDTETPASGYPSPSDVRAGVVYGANNEFTGTYVGGSTATEIAAAILAAAQVTPIKSDLQTVRGQTLKGDGSTGNPWNPA